MGNLTKPRENDELLTDREQEAGPNSDEIRRHVGRRRAAFERVYRIVSSQLDRRPVVVVSAMTKVTDALLNAFELARKGDSAEGFASLECQFRRHSEVADHFIPKDS